MGTFHQAIEISLTPGGPYRALEALVDTGATYTWIPENVLREMGAEPEFEMPFVFADGRRVNKQVTTIRARVDGRERYTPCIWGDPDTTPLLGVVTLEEMGLGVDPVNRRLIEVPGLLMRCGPMESYKCPMYCVICGDYIRLRSSVHIEAHYKVGSTKASLEGLASVSHAMLGTSGPPGHHRCDSGTPENTTMRSKRSGRLWKLL